MQKEEGEEGEGEVTVLHNVFQKKLLPVQNATNNWSLRKAIQNACSCDLTKT